MENATEALRIAAGMLFAMLILGLLVVFYNNMSELKRYEESQTIGEQIAEFNKQFDVYNRTLYGSELLSLVNKADNYNKTEANDKGYPNMEVTIAFNTSIIDRMKINNIQTITFSSNIGYGMYGENGIIEIMDRLERVLDYYESKTYGDKKGKYTVQQLSKMRTNERQQWYSLHGVDCSEDGPAEKDIKNYTNFKADQVAIKSKKYKCMSVQYDKTTGRIIQMNYREI